MYIKFVLLCAVLIVAVFSNPAYACSTASGETNPKILVQNAEIIVHAVASGYANPPVDGSWIRFIEFRVAAVLKGEIVPDTFLIRGILTIEDDYNDRPVPYDYVRPMGRGGSCSARHYKHGAEFLLFLKRHNPNEKDSREWGDVTPYWASMAPTNEQLRSSDDPWLLWVKDYLEKSSGDQNEQALCPTPTKYCRSSYHGN